MNKDILRIQTVAGTGIEPEIAQLILNTLPEDVPCFMLEELSNEENWIEDFKASPKVQCNLSFIKESQRAIMQLTQDYKPIFGALFMHTQNDEKAVIVFVYLPFWLELG